jgi:hypothetical protein
MKVLSIGNSFSADAQKYVARVGAAAGKGILNCNLFIGGCTLERHHANMISGAEEYGLRFFEKEDDEHKISLEAALLLEDWDVITVQQGSWSSVDFSTYEPYLTRLVEYVREKCPRAKIYLHKTWAYQDGSEMLSKTPFATSEEMFERVDAAYAEAERTVRFDGVIPSGAVMQGLVRRGFIMHRDGYHASTGAGRAALALAWVKCLCGTRAVGNSCRAFGMPVSDEEMQIIQQTVDEVVESELAKRADR